jgi:hypothetical protein
LLFPALIFLILVLAPWIDWTNRHALRRFEYLQPPRQAPIRLAAGLAMLAFLGSLFVAAYYTSLGFSLGEIWAFVIVVPAAVAVAALLIAYRTLPPPAERFDPTTAGNISAAVPQPPAVTPRPSAVARPPSVAGDQLSRVGELPVVHRDGRGASEAEPVATGPLSARGEQARSSLIAALQECGDLATAVEHLQGPELMETLNYIDSLRLGLTESNQALQGVLRAEDEDE